MSEYIELSTITPSSSEESVFNRPSTSSGVRHRGGYVSIPIHSSNSSISSAGSTSKTRVPSNPKVGGAAVAAGNQYQHIFEGQLGSTAAHPNNPLGNWFHKQVYGTTNEQKYLEDVKKLFEPHGLKVEKYNPAPSQKYSQTYKPYGLPWNKETKAQWPQHWKLVNPRAGQNKNRKAQQQARDGAILSRGEPPRHGLVLPFSNNIGPGNPIRPATNRADLIAQGHDIHYQQAKTDSDVLSADREAISQFAHEAIQGKDPLSRIHAAVGGIGLGAKHTVERLTGKVFYGKQCLELDLWVRILRIVLIGIV